MLVEETKKKDFIHLKYQGSLSKEKIFNLRLAVGFGEGISGEVGAVGVGGQNTASAKALS